MVELKQIENYILYLITECALSITIHPIEKETLISTSRLHSFNIHDNSYCTCIKTAKGGHERCIFQQKKVYEKLVERKDSFCGVCHAGVFEFIYPLRNSQKIIGFISVGGYSCENGKMRIPQLKKTDMYAKAPLQKAYSTLCSKIPDKKRIDTLLMPLCSMIELLYVKHGTFQTPENLSAEIARYIRNHYDIDLKSTDICERFGCSRSYLTHTFKLQTGKNFKEYLIDIRIENAKRLLGYSELNVSEIAFSVGFKDANYFSNVFKSRVEKSPLAYKKQCRSF